MDREALIAFAERDRRAVAASRTEHWRLLRQREGLSLRIASELRRHAIARCPGWPSEQDRDADLAVHIRVGEALRRAGTVGAR